MCQAIVKPAGVHIDKAILRRAWNMNQDGAGFCYRSDDGKAIKIDKGYFKFRKFYRAYVKHEAKELLIHFRWGTHGSRSVENCHPFAISPDAALIHNGILSGFTPPLKSDISDTRFFIERFFAPGLRLSGCSAHAYVAAPALRGFVEALIGGSNKLAVMTLHGVTIFNEVQGEWKDGAWYSAGYPDEIFAQSYFDLPPLTRTASTYPSVSLCRAGLGEDTWLEDMDRLDMRDHPDGELEDTLDEEEEEEDENRNFEDDGRPLWGDSIATLRDQAACCLCGMTAPPRLYSIDGQNVCGACWHQYSGLERETWTTRGGVYDF
jgi:hypothetical protein